MTGAVEPDLTPDLAAGPVSPGLPQAQAVWAEAHAALMDHLARREPAHALKRLARSLAYLLGVPCCLASLAQAEGRPAWVFQGGGDFPEPPANAATAAPEAADSPPPPAGQPAAAGPVWPGRWHLRLSHGGQAVGVLQVALAPPLAGRDALARRLQPALDTAAALMAALLEQQGDQPPASLSLARAAMREAGTFVWEWDIVTDVLGDIDEGALMLGYDPHVIGHTQVDWNALIHPDDLAAIEEAYEAHVSGASDRYRALYRARAADGSWRWIEERGRVVERDADGRPRRMFGTQTDATVQHALEQARRDHLAAEAASAAKTQFLSRVSHELRTPLNAVLGFAQLLDLDSASALNDTQRRRVSLIRQAGDYLLAMIGDLLDLSLVESGRLQMQLEPVALATLAQDCLDLVRGQADAAGVQLHLLPIDPAWQVRADPMRLKQVLINLLTNGIKYNRSGGAVWVSAQAEGAQRMSLRVRDSGLGIPEDERAGLFQPFNRLGRESSGVPGSGLGLALSQALVTVMGGTLELHHAEAPGSLFVVQLAAA